MPNAFGTSKVGPGTNVSAMGQLTPVRVAVNFPFNFGAVPTVIATPLQDPNYKPGTVSDTFAVTITSVTLSGFTANIIRTDTSQSAWGQNLQLNWMAFSNDY